MDYTWIIHVNQSINNSEKLKLNRIIGELEIKDLDFSHEKSNFYLFKNISFKVSPGKILNISGANGTGKTTLAKIILGILTPSNGDILIDKTNILKLSTTNSPEANSLEKTAVDVSSPDPEKTSPKFESKTTPQIGAISGSQNRRLQA